MKTEFNACQTLSLQVPNQDIPIEHYLRQPQRLVHAITDPKRVEQLDPNLFRLKLRPLQFFMLSAQPSVDLRVWTGEDGVLYLQSVAARILGLEAFNLDFGLTLQGHLSPHRSDTVTHLRGKADLNVYFKLPPPLWFTPRSILNSTGTALLKGILLTIKQRLEHQLLSDYQHWVRHSPPASTPAPLFPLERVVS